MGYNVYQIDRGGTPQSRLVDQNMNEPTKSIEELEAEVAASMEAILSLLNPEQAIATHDAAMIQLGVSADVFVEPLNRHEVQVLACALYMEERGGALLTYQDVLMLTDRFSGKAMNLTMVYRTIERLIDRGMLIQAEVPDNQGGRSRSYAIHGYGREAFRLAVLNSRLLAASKSPAAA